MSSREQLVPPKVNYPADLPIVERREEILRAVEENPVVVICGATGSGKSTQLPKMCLELGRGVKGYIGHTQPRRIAARSIAKRISQEVGCPLGREVGYKVRFHDRVSERTFIKVMTDGILLAETQGDRELRQYDTIIIDEAHERSLNIDFLLGYLKQLLARRRDLKVIITSATIDPARFSEHFDDAPVIEVSGRMYPVEIRYRSLASDDADQMDRSIEQGILDAVDELATIGNGDILVFLPGEREIRETAEALSRHHPPHTQILPLYGRQSTAEQDRVFEVHQERRIVLATNVAETSLTVPGIRYVVDAGVARISRYSARSKVQRLPIEPISQASANQRSGRCGRVAAGVCIRLYDEHDYEGRKPFTDPEVLRTNLASVILQMKSLRLGDVRQFPFLEPPRAGMIKAGYQTLLELGAIDEEDRLTKIGHRLARLPIDPRLGRMILAAEEQGCVREMLVLAAALSVQDPRDRPMDRQQAADEAHEKFVPRNAGNDTRNAGKGAKKDEKSDFLTLLNVWRFYHEQKEKLSWSKLRKACQQNFLSFLRMREWVDVHGQLKRLMTERGEHLNEQPADADAIHRAVLTGLLSNVGHKGDRHEYSGAHDRTFHIFPGSSLFGESPKWVMAAEVVETTKLYARTVATVRPEWIERAAEHLVNRRHFDPYWDQKQAQVMGYERVLLYGIELVARRRMAYGAIDPRQARELFIHHALVLGEYETRAPFFAHNWELKEAIEREEAKHRRRDLLVDAYQRYDFYDKRLPMDVVDGKSLDAWLSRVVKQSPEVLFMRREDLLNAVDDGPAADAFPDAIRVGGNELSVTYRFEPGHEEDGMSVHVPVELIDQVDADQLGWLAPGLLRDKVIAMLRSLPRELRTRFVPAPDFADACVARIAFGQGRLEETLAACLSEMSGVSAAARDWRMRELPDHLSMLIMAVDDRDEVVARGRDLADVRREVHETIGDVQLGGDDAQFNQPGSRAWTFGDLAETVETKRRGMTLVGFPGLVDLQDEVALRLFSSIETARHETAGGLRRLFALRVAEELAFHVDHLPDWQEMTLNFLALGAGDVLRDQCGLMIAAYTFLHEGEILRTEAAFEQRLTDGWNNLAANAMFVNNLVRDLLEAQQEVRAALDDPNAAPAMRETMNDLQAQLDRLIGPTFLIDTPRSRLAHVQRYLEGMRVRLSKATGGGLGRDAEKMNELRPLQDRYDRRAEVDAARGAHSEALDAYRWLLEEFRVSLFAQELGTAEPVSAKRLDKQWALVEDGAV